MIHVCILTPHQHLPLRLGGLSPRHSPLHNLLIPCVSLLQPGGKGLLTLISFIPRPVLTDSYSGINKLCEFRIKESPPKPNLPNNHGAWCLAVDRTRCWTRWSKGEGIDEGVPRRRFALQGTSRGITEDTGLQKTPPKKNRAFGAILLLFVLVFSVLFMFLTPKTIVLALSILFLELVALFSFWICVRITPNSEREKNSSQKVFGSLTPNWITIPTFAKQQLRTSAQKFSRPCHVETLWKLYLAPMLPEVPSAEDGGMSDMSMD